MGETPRISNITNSWPRTWIGGEKSHPSHFSHLIDAAFRQSTKLRRTLYCSSIPPTQILDWRMNSRLCFQTASDPRSHGDPTPARIFRSPTPKIISGWPSITTTHAELEFIREYDSADRGDRPDDAAISSRSACRMTDAIRRRCDARAGTISITPTSAPKRHVRHQGKDGHGQRVELFNDH